MRTVANFPKSWYIEMIHKNSIHILVTHENSTNVCNYIWNRDQTKPAEFTVQNNILGSGKTSLLDVIACRTEGKVTGKVYYNNYECSKEVIKQYGAYVMQADRFLHNLTVRETLRYAAFLRLPGRTTKFEIENKVRHVWESCTVLLFQMADTM